jgi:hypothetical protein
MPEERPVARNAALFINDIWESYSNALMFGSTLLYYVQVIELL